MAKETRESVVSACFDDDDDDDDGDDDISEAVFIILQFEMKLLTGFKA